MQQKLATLRRHRAHRSRGGQRGRVHRRRAAQHRLDVRGAQAAHERTLTADQVIGRLRAQLAHEPGASLFLQPVQDIRIGGRQANAQYQYTLQGDDLNELRTWEPQDPPGAVRPARARRRQHRPAGQGPADVAGDRPRCRRAPGHDAAHDRRDAQRRVRPAPGRHDLQPAQPVPRGDGGGAAFLAEPRGAQRRVRQLPSSTATTAATTTRRAPLAHGTTSSSATAPRAPRPRRARRPTQQRRPPPRSVRGGAGAARITSIITATNVMARPPRCRCRCRSPRSPLRLRRTRRSR